MADTALVPIVDMERMANVMAASSMFGKSREQILSLMLVAQAEGLHPATAVQEYDIIQGKPALKSQAALARFIRDGGRVEWKIRTDAEATAAFHHPSQVNPVTVSWTIDKATRMGLSGKDNWKKQPGIMLQWRTVAEGVRICDPACLNRMYLVEEVQDFDLRKPNEIRDVTPQSDSVTPVSSVPESDPNPRISPQRQRYNALKESTNLTDSEKVDMLKSLQAEKTAPGQDKVLDFWENAVMQRGGAVMTPADEAGASEAFDKG